MRIVFGILSSVNTSEAVQQLIDTIDSKHIIIVHHDFSKQPDFHVTGDNVHILKDYVVTEWGGWSLVEAVVRLMDYALKNIPDWDYFQLLSDTCLPIQPISAFENYLETTKPDANISCIAVLKQPEVLLSHGRRAFCSKQSFIYRILRKFIHLSDKIRKMDGSTMFQGLTIPVYANDNNPLVKFFAIKLPSLVIRFAEKGIGFTHPFKNGVECYVGSQFFGCTKQVCQQIEQWMIDHEQVVADFKTQISIPDEFFFQTVIGNLHLAHYAPTNHLINFFDSRTSHGAEISLNDLERLKASGKFFARKFSKNPQDEMRLNIINEVK